MSSPLDCLVLARSLSSTRAFPVVWVSDSSAMTTKSRGALLLCQSASFFLLVFIILRDRLLGFISKLGHWQLGDFSVPLFLIYKVGIIMVPVFMGLLRALVIFYKIVWAIISFYQLLLLTRREAPWDLASLVSVGKTAPRTVLSTCEALGNLHGAVSSTHCALLPASEWPRSHPADLQNGHRRWMLHIRSVS